MEMIAFQTVLQEDIMLISDSDLTNLYFFRLNLIKVFLLTQDI